MIFVGKLALICESKIEKGLRNELEGGCAFLAFGKSHSSF